MLKMQNPHEMQSLISPCFPAWCPGGRTQQNAARDCAAPPRRVMRRRAGPPRHQWSALRQAAGYRRARLGID